jgi:hypothetical protein
MLERLCGHSCESDEVADIYIAIDAEDPSNHYNPIMDFPFFGKRLVAIQDYVRGHNPHNFKALWYDRRNVSWWWTFWVRVHIHDGLASSALILMPCQAVIFIGGLTLVFTLTQVESSYPVKHHWLILIDGRPYFRYYSSLDLTRAHVLYFGESRSADWLNGGQIRKNRTAHMSVNVSMM